MPKRKVELEVGNVGTQYKDTALLEHSRNGATSELGMF
jgi:hypothetical protein